MTLIKHSSNYLPWCTEVTIGEPVAIVGGAVYKLYIPDVRPDAAWLNVVWGEGDCNPDARRGGIGGGTEIPFPNPKGGKQSPAAAALLKSMAGYQYFIAICELIFAQLHADTQYNDLLGSLFFVIYGETFIFVHAHLFIECIKSRFVSFSNHLITFKSTAFNLIELTGGRVFSIR